MRGAHILHRHSQALEDRDIARAQSTWHRAGNDFAKFTGDVRGIDGPVGDRQHDVPCLGESPLARVDKKSRSRDERGIHLALVRPTGPDCADVRPLLNPFGSQYRLAGRRRQDDEVRAGDCLLGARGRNDTAP